MKIIQKRENHTKMQAKNHKDTEGTLQNLHILRKILYSTLAKIVKINEIHEKSLKYHRKNRKDTEGTLQNRV